jgi:hypothetical protein
VLKELIKKYPGTNQAKIAKKKLSLIKWGVGEFFTRQEDRSDASNEWRAIAAPKGKTRIRFLLVR